MPVAAWSFNTPGSTDGWAGFANTPGVAQVASPSLDGQGALQVTPTTALWSVNVVTASIPALLAASRLLVVSALVLAPAASSLFLAVQLYTAAGAAVGSEVGVAAPVAAGGVWTAVSGGMLIPPGAGVAARVEVRLGSADLLGVHYVDDVEVNAVPRGVPRTAAGGPVQVKVGSSYVRVI